MLHATMMNSLKKYGFAPVFRGWDEAWVVIAKSPMNGHNYRLCWWEDYRGRIIGPNLHQETMYGGWILPSFSSRHGEYSSAPCVTDVVWRFINHATTRYERIEQEGFRVRDVYLGWQTVERLTRRPRPVYLTNEHADRLYIPVPAGYGEQIASSVLMGETPICVFCDWLIDHQEN